MTKPTKSLSVQTTPPGRFKIDLYGSSQDELVVWGSDSKSDFIDVVSIGPITRIVSTEWDGVTVSAPFVSSQAGAPFGPFVGPYTHESSYGYFHDGSFPSKPWNGRYPYVERTETLNVIAESKDERAWTYTDFTRQVSGVGVKGIRLMFNATQFIQLDNQNRRKHAGAHFKVEVLDEDGVVIKSEDTLGRKYYYCKNPTAIPLTIMAPAGYEDTAWQYKITMAIFGRENRVPVGGSWVASSVTELYTETQWYEHIAYCSGSISAEDTGGALPVRTYLVEGYQVSIPVFTDVLGVPTFLGEFTKETSNSHAWNILAVLTDDKWAGDLLIDKINLDTFLAFEEYCAFQINGERRHTFSQHLIKPTNYFKLASQIAGTADAKLYEDTAGRVGVLLDQKSDQRRVVTSYDITDEHVKITTVPTTKKLNYIQVEFEDENNRYSKTILHVEDSESINTNGIIKKQIKLDTCTLENEAMRIATKMLAISQYISDTYHLTVGPSHEDLQIGDILEVYDRKHSNVNYCGKVAAGSTDTIININPATPIDLTNIEGTQMDIAIWTGTEVLRGTVSTWTDSQIVLTAALSEAPVEFLSFGIAQLGDDTLSPTLMKVMDLTDSKEGLKVGCISYNHSLYDHVESGDPLVIPPTVYTLDTSLLSDITGLAFFQSGLNLRATWDELVGYNYTYSLAIQELNPLGINEWRTLETGSILSATTLKEFPFPLNSGTYRFTITALSLDGTETGTPGVSTHILESTIGGSLNAPDSVGVLVDESIITAYTGRELLLGWTMTDPLNEVYEFRITLVQNATTLTVVITDPTLRQHIISEEVLANTFGEDFERDFVVDIFAIDEDLLAGPSTQAAINNAAPPLPTVVVQQTGDVTLSTGATIENDTTESVVYIWESSDIGSVRPANAIESRSDDLYNHSVSGEIEQDGRDYLYEAGWVDTFGEEGANWARSINQFNPDFQVPDIPELTQITPITTTSVFIRWEHDLTWLINMKAEYRVVGEDLDAPWTEDATIFVFPTVGGEPDRGYDSGTGAGYILIEGLIRNTLYEFRVRVANTASAYSDYSVAIEGTALSDAVLPEEFEDALIDALGDTFDVDPRDLIVEGVFDAFSDYSTSAALFEETAISVSENGKRIDSINQIRAELDTPDTGIYAQILEMNTTIVTNEEAFAARVIVVDAGFNDSNANITTNATAIATESTARATEIGIVTAAVGDVEADVVTITAAVATHDTAIATNATNISAEVNDRTAAITSVETAYANADTAIIATADTLRTDVNGNITLANNNQTAISTETSARISADNVLTATTSSNTDEIALARSEAIAAIGYCTIVGQPTGHQTKVICEGAGGTWVDAPLAESVNNVEVVSGVDTATVGSFFGAYVDLEGQLVGQATLGVTGGGVFTGMDIIGGASLSQIIFKAGNFQFQDSTSAVQLEYTGGVWTFSGDLSAAGGTFSGELSAASGSFAGSITGGTIDIGDDFSVDSFGNATLVSATVESLVAGDGGTINGIGVHSTATGTSSIGVHGVSTATSGVGIGVQGTGDVGVVGVGTQAGVIGSGDRGVQGNADGGSNHCFYASATNGAATYSPFTGSHEGLIPSDESLEIEAGDIVCDVILFRTCGISDAITVMKLSDTSQDKTARGIFLGRTPDFDPEKVSSLSQLNDDEIEAIEGKDLISFNALGEGLINVCGENGDIESGDLLTTSNMAGKAMKQDDDIIRSITVAESRETVTFSSPDEVKQIAVIYKCG